MCFLWAIHNHPCVNEAIQAVNNELEGLILSYLQMFPGFYKLGGINSSIVPPPVN